MIELLIAIQLVIGVLNIAVAFATGVCGYNATVGFLCIFTAVMLILQGPRVPGK